MHANPIRNRIEVESEIAANKCRCERSHGDHRRRASQRVERVDTTGRAQCVQTTIDRSEVDALYTFTDLQSADRHLARNQIWTQRTECDQ